MSSDGPLSRTIHPWNPHALRVFAKPVIAAIAVFSLALSTPARAGRPVAIDAPVQLYKNLLWIAVRINGHTFAGIYDCGAETSALSSEAVGELGLTARRGGWIEGFGGRIERRKLHNIRVEFGNGGFAYRTIVVFDFAQLSAALGRRLDFIIGSDALRDFVIQIDPQARQIHWTPRRQFTPPSGSYSARLTCRGPAYCIPMSVNGVTGIAVIDTGNNTPLSLAHDFALRAGIDPNAGVTWQGLGVGGQHENRTTSVPHAELGGVALNDVPTTIESGQLPTNRADINLGLGVLLRYHVYLDYRRRDLWLTPLADAGTAPFERDLTGMSVQRGGSGRFVVRLVSDRGPARAAGLTGGEEITAIDGMAVSDRPADQPFDLGSEGATHTLTLADGRTIALTLARYY